MSVSSPGVRAHRTVYDGAQNFRVLAALGVVLLHICTCIPEAAFAVGPWIRLRNCSVEFFTAAAFFFLTQSLLRDPDRSFLAFLKKRFLRIEVPFLVWTVLYWFAWGVLYSLYKGTPVVGLRWSLVACGYWHLYFLQFLFVSSACAFPLLKFLARRLRQSRQGFLRGAVAALLGLLGIGWASADHAIDLSGATNALAGSKAQDAIILAKGTVQVLGFAPLGIAFGLLGDRLGAWYQARAVRLASAFFVGTTAVTYLVAEPTPVLRWLYGASVFAAVLQPWPAVVTRMLGPAADASYSVYILHVFFVQALMAVQHRVGVPLSAAAVVVGGLAVFGSALLVSLVLQKFALFRWALPALESPARLRRPAGTPARDPGRARHDSCVRSGEGGVS